MSDSHATHPFKAAHASGGRPTALDAGIFAVSLAILLVELLLTRIFSVVMYHHFSFLSVSLAMTGIGLGGLLVTLLPRTFRRDNLSVLGPALAIGFAAAVIVGSWVAFHTPIKLQETADNWGNLLWILLSCLLPFILGGLVIAHILAFNAEPVIPTDAAHSVTVKVLPPNSIKLLVDLFLYCLARVAHSQFPGA